MRAISFIAAIFFLMASSPIAGSRDAEVPAIGAFSYSGSLPMPQGQPTVVAGLTRAVRS